MKPPKSPKEALLEGFIDLIGSLGAHQVTLQKAAKKAKVPVSTAHYYYGGDWNRIFEDAVLKVFKEGQDYVSQYIQANTTITSNPLDHYIDGTFHWIMDYKAHVQLLLFNYYFASINASKADQQANFIETARVRVMSLLFEAKGRGFYPKLKVTKEAAHAAHGIIFGYGIMGIIQNSDEKNVRNICNETKQLIKRLL